MNWRKYDPVKGCDVYKNIGCSHVDGPLCDYPKCSLLEEYRNAQELEYKYKNAPAKEERKKTIAFDFDNVIHKYRKGWHDGEIYDDLDDYVLKLIADLVNDGHRVFILSTRSRRQIKKHFDSFRYDENTSPDGNPDNGMNFPLNDKIPFAYRTFGPRQKFWNVKGVVGICNHKAVFDVLIDDRAMTWVPNDPFGVDIILAFEPHKQPK